MTVIWEGACAPCTKKTRGYRLATAHDVSVGHTPGSYVDCWVDGGIAVKVRVGIIDGHRVVVDAIDSDGNVVAAQSLSVGQRSALDRQPLDTLPRYIAAVIGLVEITP